MISSFCVGTSMSSTAIERPARVAMEKPVYISLSAKITVSRKPQRRKLALISREISFFFSGLLMSSNGQPGRQDFREQRAADGGLVARQLLALLAVDVERLLP